MIYGQDATRRKMRAEQIPAVPKEIINIFLNAIGKNNAFDLCEGRGEGGQWAETNEDIQRTLQDKCHVFNSTTDCEFWDLAAQDLAAQDTAAQDTAAYDIAV
jgi:hypothetical protein